ncbi:DedA family protein [Streptomyces sp. NPDC051677]|uniref:DedA family protein n=1 Tax=Streptomyces sp. NPDC051677 TaxID=3365669 RepID=UPI0037D85FAA
MFSDVLDWLQSSPQPVVLAGAALIALGEAIVGVGLFLPGEAAMLIASSTVDSVPEFLLLWTVATVFSIAGNVIGFELGRRLGPALRETKLIKKRGAEGWDKASALLLKHGTRAVFVGRLIPLVRGFVPAVAGAARMSYRTFLPPVAAGATISTVLPILFALGVLSSLKSSGGVIFVVGLLGALAVTIVVRKRRRKAAPDAGRRSPDADPDPDLESAH